MHQKSLEADGADRAGGEYKVSEVVKMVRTCQNSLGQNGTHLGLLLLVGPNGDGFGGQAFMEHYTGDHAFLLRHLTTHAHTPGRTMDATAVKNCTHCTQETT
jgi:hypothetical protein